MLTIGYIFAIEGKDWLTPSKEKLNKTLRDSALAELNQDHVVTLGSLLVTFLLHLESSRTTMYCAESAFNPSGSSDVYAPLPAIKFVTGVMRACVQKVRCCTALNAMNVALISATLLSPAWALNGGTGEGTAATEVCTASSVNGEIACGAGSQANNRNSTAMGTGSQATGPNSTANGANSKATGTNSFALGANSNDGGADNVVSVGTVGGERRIVNFADGTLSASSTDAVNGRQLFDANQRIATGQANANAALQTASSAQSTANTALTIAGTAQTAASAAQVTADGAIAQGKGAIAKYAGSVALGEGAQANADPITAIGSNAIANGNNSVALGQGSVANRDNTVSVGSDTQQRQIANVAAGVQTTDAVNVGQLGVAVGEALGQANSYAARGVAAAMAAAPQLFLNACESGVGLGIGNYDGQTAVGASFAHVTTSGYTNQFWPRACHRWQGNGSLWPGQEMVEPLGLAIACK